MRAGRARATAMRRARVFSGTSQLSIVSAGEVPSSRIWPLKLHKSFDGRRAPALVVGRSHWPAILLQLIGCVAHQHGQAGELEHLEVVVIVADGHDLGALVA